MARIFLSYAREDVDSAKQLAESVGRAGHDVWWDRHIQGGSRFTTEIDRALKDAEVVVVLWTEASIESAWVQDEAAEGRDTGRLVPVTLRGCRPPLGFRQFHTISLDLDGSAAAEQVDELIAAVANTAGEGAAAKEAAHAAEQPLQRQTSICVLPFVNMSGDPEQEYFSDGITEDIITDLSKVSALLVIARNTSFTFKGKVMDVKDVARALDVTHVLEGSVRKAGDRVRITAQLIDAATGGHVWADRYDRDLTDIFAIQDEISKSIVAALRLKLLPNEKKAIETRGTSNIDAYNLYLMARQQWISGTYGDRRCAEAIIRMCKQAVTLDANYAEAWALMALAQAELRFWLGTDDDALPAAERAIAINPDLPEARCVKARYLEQDGRVEEALEQLDLALRSNPESWEVNREAARIYFRQGRIADAIRFFEKSMTLMPTDFHSPSMLVSCYLSTGDEEARRRAAKLTLERSEAAIAKDPSNVAALAAGAASLVLFDEIDRAREWSRRAVLLDPDNPSMLYNLGCSFGANLKDRDAALDLFGQFFERGKSTTVLRHMEVDPDIDLLRDDPRFKAMFEAARERLGMPPLAASKARSA
jgi:adenylate cyclase